MIEKVKQSTSEKLLLVLFIILGVIAIYIFFILPQKCLFIKDYDPKKLSFKNPENIAILNINCGNVIIELNPEISPNSVKRFKMLLESRSYDNIAFHNTYICIVLYLGVLLSDYSNFVWW